MGGILDWLGGEAARRRNANPFALPPREAGPSMGFGYGMGSRLSLGGAAPATGIPPATAAFAQNFGRQNAARAAALPALSPDTFVGPVGPVTKTEPTAPLRFSWGKNDLGEYQPGITDVLKMSGAPGLSDTTPGGPSSFMGLTPSSKGGTVSGGLTPRPTAGMSSDDMINESARGVPEQDWSRVANPTAFSAYTERPEIAALERASKDPLWAERDKADIEGRRDIGIAQATVQAQAEAVKRAEQQKQQQIEDLAQQWIKRKNDELRAAGKPPLDLAGENDLYMQAAQRTGQRMF